MNRDNIKRTLSNLRAANSSPDVGKGAQQDSWTLVAQFYNRRFCQKFVAQLASKGISATRKDSRVQIEVHVRKKDLGRALDELEDHRRTHLDRRPRNLSRLYDFSILVFSLGTLLAFFQTVIIGDWKLGLASFWTFLGAAWLLFRCRRNYLLAGGQQFSLRDTFAFVFVVAVAILSWRFALA